MSFIAKDVDVFLGKKITCQPVFGWGWRSIPEVGGAKRLFSHIEEEGSFEVELHGYFGRYGVREGFFGVITTEKHLFSGLIIEGITMQRGKWNFTDKICSRIDVQIGSIYPEDRGEPMTEGVPIYGGHVVAAESQERIYRWSDEIHKND